MSNNSTGWLKGCGIGCGVVFVLSILVTIGSGLLIMKPFNGAIESRRELDERFGEQASYRPPLNGVVARDRLETFLEIRRALMPNCEGFEQTFNQFEQMDELGNQESVPKRQMFMAITRMTGSVLGLAGKIGGAASSRNTALSEQGMGLGEYTYIYVTAYYSWLGNRPQDGNVSIDEERISLKIRKRLRGMISHQLEDLRDAPSTPLTEALIDDVLAELAILSEDLDRLPWQDGLPPAMAAAYEPYRMEFEKTWCPEMAPFDLSTHKRRGMFTIHSE